MEEIAQVYARALFEVASERDLLDVVRGQLGAFTDALHESHQLQTFFFSPYFSTDEKIDGLKKITNGQWHLVLGGVKPTALEQAAHQNDGGRVRIHALFGEIQIAMSEFPLALKHLRAGELRQNFTGQRTLRRRF